MTDPAPAVTGRTSAVVTAVAFAALLAVLCVLSGLRLYYSWHSVRDEIQDDLTSLARVAAASAGQFLQHYARTLPMLAQDLTQPWRQGDIQEISARLRRYKNSDGNVSAVYLFSAAGEMLASSEPSTIKASTPHMQDPVFRQDLLKALSQEPMVVGRTRFGAMINDWILPLRMRGNADGPRQPFVLSAVIAMGGRQGLWNGLAPMPSAQIGLLRDDGFTQYLRPFPADPKQAFSTTQRCLRSHDARSRARPCAARWLSWKTVSTPFTGLTARQVSPRTSAFLPHRFGPLGWTALMYPSPCSWPAASPCSWWHSGPFASSDSVSLSAPPPKRS
ncbi:MAG: hypothetical protein FJY37_00200 [Betaproteobacteria bacterium]|nr:hypothetical protein [Betaproteobacteria bacterium]